MKKIDDLYWGTGPKDMDDDDEGSISMSEDKIATVNNHMYFYAAVTRAKILEFNRKLRMLDQRLANQASSQNTEKPKIYLHIHSNGGSVFSAMAAIDTIQNCECDVVTIVEGSAASAATLMSIVGTRRCISKHSYMLIHQVSSACWGTWENFKDNQVNLDNLMKVIKQLYKEHSKVPMKEIDEILKHDIWWDAETCLKYGLVDEII